MSPASLKLIAIFAALSVAFGAAWSWRSSIAETEVRTAVDGAIVKKVGEIQDKLDEERTARVEYQEKSSAALTSLLNDLQRIRKTQSQVGVSVARDVSENKDFYQQALPAAGREAWISARETAVQPASSASAP